MKKMGTALRFYSAKRETMQKDLARLSAFVDAALAFGPVYVAVNIAEDVADTIGYLEINYPEDDVIAFGVTPWQKFVAPANALIYRMAMDGIEIQLSASTEFPLIPEYVNPLLEHLDDQTLFVAARLPEHVFEEGVHQAEGNMFPWGTYGIWNLAELSLYGMPMAGDAPWDQTQAGVEEMGTVALYQALADVRGFAAHAKLIELPSFYGEWNTDGWDEERHEKHQKKIAAKASRPAEQARMTRVPKPMVHHIVHNSR